MAECVYGWVNVGQYCMRDICARRAASCEDFVCVSRCACVCLAVRVCVCSASGRAVCVGGGGGWPLCVQNTLSTIQNERMQGFSVRAHVCDSVRMSVCTCVCANPSGGMCVHKCVSLCVAVCLCVCTCVCIWMWMFRPMYVCVRANPRSSMSLFSSASPALVHKAHDTTLKTSGALPQPLGGMGDGSAGRSSCGGLKGPSWSDSLP